MDFVNAWKASSIVLTGAFGVLGLIKEFKDKDTHQITRWGYVSLVGILMSSSLGLLAQLKESSESDKAKKATADQTLALAQKTDRTISDIQRVLSPLAEPRVSLSFTVDCDNDKYKKFCTTKEKQSKLDGTHYGMPDFPGGSRVIMDFTLDIFLNPKDADNFIEGHGYAGDIQMKLKATSYGKNKSLIAYSEGGDGAEIEVDDAKANVITNNGKIRSVLDLHGATTVLSENHNRLTDLKLMFVEVSANDGEFVIADGFSGEFEKSKVKVRAVTAYRVNMREDRR